MTPVEAFIVSLFFGLLRRSFRLQLEALTRRVKALEATLEQHGIYSDGGLR